MRIVIVYLHSASLSGFVVPSFYFTKVRAEILNGVIYEISQFFFIMMYL